MLVDVFVLAVPRSTTGQGIHTVLIALSEL